MSADPSEQLAWLRPAAALLAFTALLALLPLLGLITMTLLGGTFQRNDVSSTDFLFFLWTIAALALAMFNAVFGIVNWRTPRPKMLFRMLAAAIIVLLTCPYLLLWFAG